MHRYCLLYMLLGLGSWAMAEPAPSTPAPQAQGPQSPGPPRGSGSIQVWDDRVFELGSKAAPPETRKSAAGVDRYLGQEADYNRGQRDQWLAACEPMKNVDLRAYRDCFAEQKRKSGEKLQQNRAEVEGRSALPVRNIPSPRFDSESQRNPIFDVKVERSDE